MNHVHVDIEPSRSVKNSTFLAFNSNLRALNVRYFQIWRKLTVLGVIWPQKKVAAEVKKRPQLNAQ